MKLRGLSIVTILVLVLLTLLSLSNLSSARVLDTAEIKVRIHVPVIQQMQIIEPVAVNFNYPWPGAERGQPLIFENIGNILVQSNADWSLTINSLANNGFRVFVRPSGDRFASWIPANGFTNLNGKQGSNNLSWDIKIEAPHRTANIAAEPLQETVQFAFTIGQI